MPFHSAYVVDGVRTPIGRYGGVLAAVRPDDLAAGVIATLMARHPQIEGSAVDEVLLGCVNQAGEDNRNVARMAVLLAGLPATVPAATVNRLCASGLEAVAAAARTIAIGEADLVIAGGVESMSRAPYILAKPDAAFSRDPRIHDSTIGWRFVNPALASKYGIDSMPETAENVAAHFEIGREDQDAFAFRSQQRAAAAIASGRLAREVVPVTVPGRHGEAVRDVDEHPRPTSMAALAGLPTPFRAGGSVTAGNSSGINDGAGAILLASEIAVRRYGLVPLARMRGVATAGVDPRLMGMGPVPATRTLLDRHRLTVDDIDRIELNEAFAAQALACLREWGIADDAEHVNPHGGAIALGHPLGMSGARLVLTAAIDLADRKSGRALIALCVGVGQGMAALVEAV